MTANKPGDPTTLSRLYGRAKGKTLRAGQQGLIDTLLPRIAVPNEGPVTVQGLFGSDRPLHFEIGFGGGEHMAGRADMLPDHGFIGCEPFLNGVAQALTHVDGDNGAGTPLGNVRIHHGDALEVLARIPDGPVRMIAAKLKPGGEFRFGTDHPVYLRHALMVMQRHTAAFEWLCEGPKDFLRRPGGWPETRYEAKARKLGHEVWYFRYRRAKAD
jgi:tRNA (guanine-N7-)-methyltransferase